MKINAFDIIKVVCRVVEIEDITLRTKQTEYAYARFLAIGLIKQKTKLSYKAIAAIIDRDETAVYWGERRFNLLSGKNGNQRFIQLHRKISQTLTEIENAV